MLITAALGAFKLLDENNDGKLTVDELNNLVYSPPRASEFEGLSDTDEQKYSVAGILKRYEHSHIYPF